MFPRKLAVPIAILALLAVVVQVYATRGGIHIAADSVNYIGAARHLLLGEGLQDVILTLDGKPMPLTHFPPLYPLLLAGIGLSGIEIPTAARWLNSLLFGVNVGLVGLLVAHYTRRSPFFTLLGAFFMLASVDMLTIHSVAFTEPLFICLTLLTLWLLALYLERPRWTLLLGAAGCAACALLTRYVGVALIAAGALGIWCLSCAALRQKLQEIGLYVGVAVFPMALWAIHNKLAGGNATDRKAGFYAFPEENLRLGLKTIGTWLVPGRVAGIFSGLLVLACIIGLIVWHRRLARQQERPTRAAPRPLRALPGLLILYLAVYSATLITSIRFFDPLTALDLRILSPIYVGTLLLVLCLAYDLVSWSDARRASAAVCAIGLLLVAKHLAGAVLWGVKTRHGEGVGYESAALRQSRIISRLETLPPTTRIFSNGPDTIYILTGRLASYLPYKTRSGYLSDVAVMARQLAAQRGVIIYLNPDVFMEPEISLQSRQRAIVLPQDLTAVMPLHLLALEPEGAIYQLGN
ncbi:MAG TPA: hypothetical protein VFB38_00910 [Chthonomonadaceae bacterium]|nr:hypothetical protein [Chthonomonadaceae bacterium]